jgi:membrane fusion protein (multidrug efflux system)
VQSGTGAVFSLLPPENATGNYVKVVQRVPVKIVFDPMPDTSDHILVPGMSVVPKVLVNSPRLAAGDIPTPTPAAVAAP